VNNSIISALFQLWFCVVGKERRLYHGLRKWGHLYGRVALEERGRHQLHKWGEFEWRRALLCVGM